MAKNGSASGQKETNSSPPPSKRPYRRGNGMKYARRRGEERLQPAGTWRQIPRRQRRDDHAGGEQNEKCTPARWRMAAASGHKVTKFTAPCGETTMPAGNRMKNARRRGEERLRPAGIRWQIPRRHRQNDRAGGEQNEICTPARWRMATASGHTGANSPPAQSKRPCRRGNRIKNARRHGEERQRPAGIR